MKTQRSVVILALTLLLTAYVQAQEENERLRTRGRIYEPLIVASAARYGIDPHLLWTIAYLESRFKPFAVSYKDGKPCARGLMQFIPATAREYGLRDPHSVPAAVDAAARYLRDLLRRFDGRGDLVLAAYNAGEGTIDAYRDGRRLVLPGGKVINPNAVRREVCRHIGKHSNMFYVEFAFTRLFVVIDSFRHELRHWNPTRA